MGILKLLTSDTPTGQATRIEYDKDASRELRRQVTKRLSEKERDRAHRRADFQRRLSLLRAQGLPLRHSDLIAYLSRKTRVENRRAADYA